jgi:hypothetical protein
MSTDRSTDRSDLDAKTDAGPGPGHGVTAHSPAAAEFDHEIGLGDIVKTGAALVAVTAVAMLIVWFLLRGIGSYDKRNDVPLSPIQAASPQPPPPEPRLQVSPNEDMRLERAQEDLQLDHAGWVSQQQGTVRVPIDVAIDVIAARGVAPQVVGGTGSAANPDQTRMQIGGTPADVRKPGATVQNAVPANPAAPAAAAPPPLR